MNDLREFNITRVHVKIDNFNYYYFVNYTYKEEEKEIEFCQPLYLCLTDIKRYIRRTIRKDDKSV